MLKKWLLSLAIWLLKSHEVTGEQKTRLISALLENVHAFPIREMLTTAQDGTILVNGNRFDYEQALAFTESINNLKDSFARRVINEQLTYMAIQLGIHQGLSPEQIQFSKAILWVIQEENRLIASVSTE